jgi:hypothetical protein
VCPLCRWSLASSTLFLALAGPAAAGEVRLEVAGDVQELSGQLLARVQLANRGDAAATHVEVEGELLGTRRVAVLADPLPAGAARAVELAFSPDAPRPGVHALALHLRYRPEGALAAAPAASQRAYLLIAIGASPPPSVRIAVADARVARYAEVPVQLESADGAAHRVRLRVLSPRGVNALEPDAPLEVPAAGTATAPLRILGAGAPAGTRAGLVVLASEVDGPLERTAVATSRVEMAAPPPPWLPRWRAPLLAGALALLAAAVVVELWWFRAHPA